MNVYADHTERCISSPQREKLEILLKICDAMIGLVQISKHGLTAHSPALDLLQTAEEQSYSLRNSLMMLARFYDLPM